MLAGCMRAGAACPSHGVGCNITLPHITPTYLCWLRGLATPPMWLTWRDSNTNIRNGCAPRPHGSVRPSVRRFRHSPSRALLWELFLCISNSVFYGAFASAHGCASLIVDSCTDWLPKLNVLGAPLSTASFSWAPAESTIFAESLAVSPAWGVDWVVSTWSLPDGVGLALTAPAPCAIKYRDVNLELEDSCILLVRCDWQVWTKNVCMYVSKWYIGLLFSSVETPVWVPFECCRLQTKSETPNPCTFCDDNNPPPQGTTWSSAHFVPMNQLFFVIAFNKPCGGSKASLLCAAIALAWSAYTSAASMQTPRNKSSYHIMSTSDLFYANDLQVFVVMSVSNWQ